MCVCEWAPEPCYVCRDQRTVFWNWFSPSAFKGELLSINLKTQACHALSAEPSHQWVSPFFCSLISQIGWEQEEEKMSLNPEEAVGIVKWLVSIVVQKPKLPCPHLKANAVFKILLKLGVVAYTCSHLEGYSSTEAESSRIGSGGISLLVSILKVFC